MALIKCKECGNKVSNSAKSCPHCGAKVPKRSGCSNVIFLVMFGFFMFYVLKDDSSKKPTTPLSKEEKALNDYRNACENNYTACKDNADIMNINTHVNTEIKSRCKLAAEQKAISTVEWGGFLSPNFGSFRPGDSGKTNGTIWVFDDVAMYQNQFGANIKRKTSCLFNLKANEVEQVLID